MLFVGASDLSLSLGREVRADSSDPIVVEAIDAILAAAKKAKLRTATFCHSVDYARAMMAKGFDLVTVTSDQGLIASGSSLSAQFADRSE
jgi:4-hydroxy-2-oxoheptanedioate aldolase